MNTKKLCAFGLVLIIGAAWFLTKPQILFSYVGNTAWQQNNSARKLLDAPISAPTEAPTEVPTNTPTPTFNANVKLTHGPVVGAVTNSTARVFVRTDKSAAIKIRYGKLARLSDAVESATQQTSADHDFTTIIPLTNLDANTVYYLDIVINLVPQERAPYPRFKTFPETGTIKPFKFVYLTDSNVIPDPPVATFVNAARAKPDFVVLGGDFPHGKSLDLERKRSFYKAIYDPETTVTFRDFVYKILYRYPVAHMWDNHDYGMPSNRFYPLRQVNMQVIQEYFPTYSLSQYGDWQKFSYAQADFFLLDSRSQRDWNRNPDGPDKSMLDGERLGPVGQLEWLKTGLKESTAQWKFILSPVPFNPTAKPKTSWGAFQYERNLLMDFIRDNGITGVLSVTGDLHMGAIDDGTHSTIPEMVVPPPNGPFCISTAFPGEWSEGTYGKEGERCNGYGVIIVKTNPPRVIFQVKDSEGTTKLKYKAAIE